MNKLILCCAAFSLLVCTTSFGHFVVAEERNDEKQDIEETVLGMNVSGNKEAPNLLYIIPWKSSNEKSDPPEIYRLMDEVYSTVDPDVFEKEVSFYKQLGEQKKSKKSKKKRKKKKKKSSKKKGKK